MDDSQGASPTFLYLIRHGQAIVNVEPIIGGMKGDRGLTGLGVQQATRLRDRLETTQEIAADVLIASSLPRARQTAEIIAPSLKLPVILDDSVQEFRSGEEGDGLTLEEYKRRFGWVDIQSEPFTPVDPGGESWTTFLFRVVHALHRILTEHQGKHIVIVCHGGIIDASFFYFFNMSGFAIPSTGFDTRNTSITCWKQVFRHGKMRWVIDRYNDDAHLRGMVVEKSIDYLDQPPAQPAVPTEE